MIEYADINTSLQLRGYIKMGKYFSVIRKECCSDFHWYRKLYSDLAYEVSFYFYKKDSKEMKYLRYGEIDDHNKTN